MDLTYAPTIAAERSPRAPTALSTMSLCELGRDISATVVRVSPPNGEEDRELVLRLLEIGFVPGETLRIIAHGHPGREPIAVRLGGTTFALRRREAAYVRVSSPV